MNNFEERMNKFEESKVQLTQNTSKKRSLTKAEDISSVMSEMINDSNGLSSFVLNEKNLNFLRELRKSYPLKEPNFRGREGLQSRPRNEVYVIPGEHRLDHQGQKAAGKSGPVQEGD